MLDKELIICDNINNDNAKEVNEIDVKRTDLEKRIHRG